MVSLNHLDAMPCCWNRLSVCSSPRINKARGLVVSSQGSGDNLSCPSWQHGEIEPAAKHTEFLPPYGIIHIEWARECWLNLKIGMFVKPSEEWAQ